MTRLASTNGSDVHDPANPATAPRRPGLAATRSIRGASSTAGIAIVLTALLAPFGALFAVQGRVTEGNAARTAASIIEHEGLFRLGIVSLLLVIALDVLVAWALYRVFSPVSQGISMLAAVLRFVYSGVFLVAISELLGVLRLLGNDDYLAVFSADQLHAQALLGISAFNDVWQAGLFLFGLHLLVVGYLAYKSGYVPRFIGVLVAIAGLGYAFDSLAAVFSKGSLPAVSSVTFVGEFVLALWLMIRGSRLVLTESRLGDDPITGAR